MHLLTLSGSLRAGSINNDLLEAVARLAPSGVTVRRYEGLGELPHFNPDLDVEPAPEPVAALRAEVAWADAILISSPEYAHGVPGSLKNGLDWLVSGVEIVGKPVMLLNASPRSTFAQESLAETLRTMSARVIGGAAVAVPINGRRLLAEQIVGDGELAGVVRGAVDLLVAAAAGPTRSLAPGRLIIQPDPDLEEVQYLEDRIYEHNSRMTGITDGEWLAIFVRDADDRITAGISGNTWGGCAEIRQFWVADAERGRGLGTRLLEAAEAEARRRGCSRIYLTTFSFQAPAFYLKHGFSIVATLDGFPRGHQNLLLAKPLSTSAESVSP